MVGRVIIRLLVISTALGRVGQRRNSRYSRGNGRGMERYSHGGYLIKVVVMALAGEVARELSPILSWSNYNYEI